MPASDKLISLAVSTAQTVLADVPHSCIQKAVNQNSILPTNISEFRMPFLTDDENVKKIIQEFHLEQPDKFAHFIVESYFAQFEVSVESINDVKQADLKNSVARIESARDMINYGIDNPSELEESLKSARDHIIEGTNELMEKVKSVYIQKIRDVDNRPKFSFFMKSKISLKDVDQANHMAKNAITALIDAYNLQILIGSKINSNIDSIHRKFSEFSEWFDRNGICRLMHAYDDTPEDGFWLTVPKTISNTKIKEDILTDYFEEAEEEFSEEDINFD